MKIPRALVAIATFFTAALSSIAADAPAPAVSSKITAVAVYGDRAVVTRTADVTLTAGTQVIRFERLPANLVDQSLQVAGHGSANVTILDVSASQTFVEETPNPRVKALEDDGKALAKQMRTIADRSTTLNEQREYVRRMLVSATSASASAPGATAPAARPTLDEWQKLYSYSDETLGKIAAEFQSLSDQKDALDDKKAAIDRQLAELRGAGGRSYKTVVVRISAAQAGNLQLNIAYSVPQASWTPAYDARVRSAQRSVELSYFGVVRQNTGEDWENVALTLSTARPSLGGGAPALPLWVVDVAQPVVLDRAATVFRGGAVDAAAFGTSQTFYSTDNGGSAARSQRSDAPAEFAQAAVSSGATSATFKISAPVSILSNNTSQRVAITTLKLESALRYESTPKMREAAYLAAPAVNNTDFPLLGGTLNTFLDDSYVATGTFTQAMPGESFDLALGVDEGIVIKRKLINRFAEDTGLSNKGRRVTYEYLVTVTNLKTTTEQVRFREPVPVSRNEKIVVKQITPQDRDIGTPTNIKEVIRENDGKLTWRLPLKPGEKREVTLKFSVEYPSDVTVSGLE